MPYNQRAGIPIAFHCH